MIGTVCAVAGSFFSAKVATGFGRVVRGRIFERVAHFSVHQFDHFSTASLITRTTNDTTQVQQVLLMLLGMAITGADDGHRRRGAVAVAGRRGWRAC